MKRKVAFFLVFLLIGSMVFSLGTAAQVAYDTYTYTYWGEPVASPHAYVPEQIFVPENTEAGAFVSASDVTVDSRGRIYIADTGNNRVVVLDENYQYLTEILGPTDDRFNEPRGVFVHEDGRLFVADTKNRRIVVFDENYAFLTNIPEPVSELFPENFIYEPAKVAVDYADRVYVICPSTNYGVIEITMEGEFKSFLGAQKVDIGIGSTFWRMLQTEEQRARSTKFVPTQYNNIAVDSQGFLYVTTDATDAQQMYAGIQGRTTDGRYMPVRKLNPSGVDVLNRTSFYPPAGDVEVKFGDPRNTSYGPSLIVDVALGSDGIYSLLDSRRGKIFTYDDDGELLYVFGGLGTVDGLAQQPVAITYRGNEILLLDSFSGKLTTYTRTEYGNHLNEAISAYNNREYTKASELWESVLGENANLDIAYIGMGKSHLFNKDYEQAMSYFRAANNTPYYSSAFREYRQDWIRQNLLWVLLILAAVGALIVLLYKVVVRVNSRQTAHNGIGRQLSYGFHIIFHPFDGFWDAKSEGRGGMAGALIILATACATFVFKAFATGYIFKTTAVTEVNVLEECANILVPLLMWCIANWCLTSLMDGEGSFRDIFITSCYALIPLILIFIPMTIVSNFIVMEEQFILTFLTVIAYVWMALLVFFGMLVIHNYSLPKNILATLLTIVGICIILFIALLGFDLVGKFISFFANIWKELSFRF